jgi:hypothetical protein
MSSKSMGRRALAVAGGAALIALGAMTAACGNGGNQAPSSTTTTPSTTTTQSTTPPPSPTEKSINPTGGNLFTPPVQAPGAPTVQPGQHPGINGVP